ncbi:ketoacyl-synt-domain-containing protein [Xylariaceae sp. FL0594]|nr:ketoacyl-synt-domain-containing protein [Xylariaceae sp. FL0594]
MVQRASTSEMPYDHLLLFGDQTENVGDTIRHLYAAAASNQSYILSKFLRDATDVCQIAFGKLHPRFRPDETGAAAEFESLLELSEQHDKTDGSAVFASCTLSYLARLGELILRGESDPTLFTSRCVYLGVCVSSFPAALAATASSATDLAQLAVEAFPPYIQMVLASYERSLDIESHHGIWSYHFPSMSEHHMEHLMDLFHETNGTHQLKSLWISAVAWDAVTVSGPPSVLARFLATPALRGALHVALPIAGAVHAPHLPGRDFWSVVQRSLPIWNRALRPGASFLSTSDLIAHGGVTLRQVVPHIFADVMSRPLHLSRTVEEAAVLIRRHGSRVRLSVVGPSSLSKKLSSTLSSNGVSVQVIPAPAIKHDVSHPPSLRAGSGAVAITGMSVRLPGGTNDLVKYLEFLRGGQTTHQEIPPDRFPLKEFYDATGQRPNSIMNTDGYFLEDPGQFDAGLFNMSPREALRTDPTHRLLLTVSHEALQKAGVQHTVDTSSPSSPNHNRTLVVFGQSGDTWRETNAQLGMDVYTAPGVLRAFSPARVSRHFGFDGGSVSVDTACSSSATAIEMACTALVNRECDMALAGGAQILTSPFEFAALGRAGFLAPSGGCKTFRADADGYCRGEAVGVLVLKRLEDAIASNDNIDALITGWGRSYSAAADSMTTPHPESQKRLMQKVLRKANVKPEDVGYVEMHGTGTRIGDAAEMKALSELFKDCEFHSVHVGSVKASVGHSESAAGVSAVTKAALMLKEDMIPPQATIQLDTTLNPEFQKLNMDPICIDSFPRTLDKNKGNILVNSFDAAGGNTCLLLSKAPVHKTTDSTGEEDPRVWHIVTISAATDFSLELYKLKLFDYLAANPDVKVSDLAYTLTARRSHYKRRICFVVWSREQLESRLLDSIEEDLEYDSASQEPVMPDPTPAVIFVFSGQGSKDFKMARLLYQTHPTFRERIKALGQMCQGFHRPDFFVPTVLFRDHGYHAGSIVDFHLTLVCVQIALAELWMSWAVKPVMVAGHSIGEYAALCIAGVLSASDALYLVAQRAALISRSNEETGGSRFGMVSIQGATKGEIKSILAASPKLRESNIACYNSPEAHVVAGPSESLEAVMSHASSRGFTATKLVGIDQAYHTEYMRPIADDMVRIAEPVSFMPPKIKVASTVTSKVVSEEGVFNANYLGRHLTSPVRLNQALQSIRDGLRSGAEPLWLEVGLGGSCVCFIRDKFGTPFDRLLSNHVFPFGNDYLKMAKSVALAWEAGCLIDWKEFHRPFESKLKLLVLPTYAFDTKLYWQPYTSETAQAMGIDVGVSGSGPENRGPDAVQFIPSATVQKLVRESVTDDGVEVVFTSSLTNPALRAAIQGHRLGNIGVCPAAVYVDMALTAATYVNNRHLSEQEDEQKVPLGEVRNMTLDRPFVLVEDVRREQEIKITVRYSSNEQQDSLFVRFDSDLGRRELSSLGSCEVFRGQSQGEDDASIEALSAGQAIVRGSGRGRGKRRITRLDSGSLYGMFNSYVQYAQRYRGIINAFIPGISYDSETREAVAQVVCTPTPAEEDVGAFVRLNPYHGDSLVQIGAFLANMASVSLEKGFLAFHIDRFSMLCDLEPEFMYTTHVRMTTDSDSGNRIINVHVWQGETLVAVAKFRLESILKPALWQGFGRTRTLIRSVSGSEMAQHTKKSAKTSLRGGFISSRGTTQGSGKTSTSSAKDMADALISTIASETGVHLSSITEATRLSELGVDSLMRIAIAQKMKAMKGVDIPVSAFRDMRTIADVRSKIGQMTLSEDSTSGCKQRGTVLPSHPGRKAVPSRAATLPAAASSAHGPPVRPFFLVAGLTGSKSSFAQLPGLRANNDSHPVCILESPFVDNPSGMAAYTPAQIAPLYISKMKQIQTVGPYLLGGYSAGAIFAFEMTRLLGEDEVEKLFIIDMKAHRPGQTWKAVPTIDNVWGLFSMLEHIGITQAPSNSGTNPTSTSSSSSLLADTRLNRTRILATLKCIHKWRPRPLAPGHRPTKGSVIIWAKDGPYQDDNGNIFIPLDPPVPLPASTPEEEEEDDDDDEHQLPLTAENDNVVCWLFASRYEGFYGLNGWGVLLWGSLGYELDQYEDVNDDITAVAQTRVVAGANHWSMLLMPHAQKLMDIIDDALTECTMQHRGWKL